MCADYREGLLYWGTASKSRNWAKCFLSSNLTFEEEADLFPTAKLNEKGSQPKWLRVELFPRLLSFSYLQVKLKV